MASVASPGAAQEWFILGGIVLAVALIPALIRAIAVSRRAPAPMSAGQNLLAFITSLGVVVMIGGAAFVPFFFACWISLRLNASIQPHAAPGIGFSPVVLLIAAMGFGTGCLVGLFVSFTFTASSGAANRSREISNQTPRTQVRRG